MNAARLLSTLAPVRIALDALSRRALPQAAAIERAVVDAGALAFHAAPPPERPVVVLIGGTGTGKSTLTNRLLSAGGIGGNGGGGANGGAGGELTASNFRRTFTAGPVAIAATAAHVHAGWLDLPHVAAASLPARGEAGRLIIVAHASAATDRLLDRVVLVDTPDVDGDQPQHHGLADRTFRWAGAAVFVVSPEKYQMTELLPYYRLAARYAVPSLFVMNKAEDREVVDDFARQLVAGGVASPRVFVQPRDDSTFAPPAGQALADLRDALVALPPTAAADRDAGLRRRAGDLAARVSDQVAEPLRALRRTADEAIAALRELRARDAGVDVDPMTRQLRKRMQQRSILYLMGPQRMLDRLRGAPALLARLPRSTLDLIRGTPALDADVPAPRDAAELPDFAAMVADQFAVAQERMADVIRAQCPGAGVERGEAGERGEGGDAWRIDRTRAHAIVVEETDALRAWLEARWNKSPRDTALILKLVQKLPGGQRLTRLSESAPYLVVVACGLNHLAFSGLDLLVIGGFSLATWLGEKLSDEVAQRTRLTNRNIDRRFGELLRRQANDAIAWLDGRVPAAAELDGLATHVDALRNAAEVGTTDEHG